MHASMFCHLKRARTLKARTRGARRQFASRPGTPVRPGGPRGCARHGIAAWQHGEHEPLPQVRLRQQRARVLRAKMQHLAQHAHGSGTHAHARRAAKRELRGLAGARQSAVDGHETRPALARAAPHCEESKVQVNVRQPGCAKWRRHSLADRIEGCCKRPGVQCTGARRLPAGDHRRLVGVGDGAQRSRSSQGNDKIKKPRQKL